MRKTTVGIRVTPFLFGATQRTRMFAGNFVMSPFVVSKIVTMVNKGLFQWIGPKHIVCLHSTQSKINKSAKETKKGV